MERLAGNGRESSANDAVRSLNSYVGSSDAYWNKTKSLLTRKEADQKEKSILAESIQSLKKQGGEIQRAAEELRRDGC